MFQPGCLLPADGLYGQPGDVLLLSLPAHLKGGSEHLQSASTPTPHPIFPACFLLPNKCMVKLKDKDQKFREADSL